MGLALGRKIGEGITIVVNGVECKISVSSVHRGQVRLFCEGGTEVVFVRTELLANGRKPKATELETGTLPESVGS